MCQHGPTWDKIGQHWSIWAQMRQNGSQWLQVGPSGSSLQIPPSSKFEQNPARISQNNSILSQARRRFWIWCHAKPAQLTIFKSSRLKLEQTWYTVIRTLLEYPNFWEQLRKSPENPQMNIVWLNQSSPAQIWGSIWSFRKKSVRKFQDDLKPNL